jgi:hypothetical protein
MRQLLQSEYNPRSFCNPDGEISEGVSIWYRIALHRIVRLIHVFVQDAISSRPGSD